MRDPARDLATIQRDVARAILGDGDDVSEGLARYREQFFLRHLAVLEEDFPEVVRAVGHDAFHDLAKRYLAAHPPASFTLRDLGRAFAVFLEDPVLRDVARLAWAVVESFDGPDAPPLDPASLRDVPEDAWPTARIVLQPSLQRLVLEHPKKRRVVVYRTVKTDLDASAYALLEEIAAGATLEEACDRVKPPREAIAGWFRAWTEAGWISTIYFPPSFAPAP
jgi:hypothetical protein